MGFAAPTAARRAGVFSPVRSSARTRGALSLPLRGGPSPVPGEGGGLSAPCGASCDDSRRVAGVDRRTGWAILSRSVMHVNAEHPIAATFDAGHSSPDVTRARPEDFAEIAALNVAAYEEYRGVCGEEAWA